VAGVESARHLCEPVPPLKGLPHSQGKEMDHVVSSCLLSDDDDFKDSSGRVRAKDRGGQASFTVTVQCLAQQVPENHNLPLLGSRFS